VPLATGRMRAIRCDPEVGSLRREVRTTADSVSASRISIGRRAFLAGAGAAFAAAAVPLRRAHGQSRLRIGLLFPRSGLQAELGLDCQRGADVALDVLRAKGYTTVEVVPGDTESNVQTARAQAERLIEQGSHMIMGCFDSGQTVAAAQVCEQKGIPLVVNVAAAPAITDGQFKMVVRNFPTGPMIATDAFTLQKELFALTGKAPQSAVMLHVNDTFGTTQRDATVQFIGRFQMPYKLMETIAYDPATRDLSAEVRRAKSTNAELVWTISRLNDAILMTREFVKQRWVPMGIISSGPGWYEDAYLKTLGRLSDDIISMVPWFDPNKPMSKVLVAAWAKKFPDRNLNTSSLHTFEAMLIALDAFKRAGSTEPGKLIGALRTTDLKDNITVGPGVHFNEKGQNPDTRNSGIQNRNGRLLAIVPASAASSKPFWPIRAWDKRG